MSRYLEIPVVPNAAMPDLQLVKMTELLELLHTHTSTE